MHILAVTIIEMVRDRVKTTIALKIASHAWPFDWHSYTWPRPILKVKVNVMHILYSEYLGNRDRWGKITTLSNNKSCVGFRFGCLHLTFEHFKCQGQLHAYFTGEYLENGQRKTL